jgi:hypothetical protein
MVRVQCALPTRAIRFDNIDLFDLFTLIVYRLLHVLEFSHNSSIKAVSMLQLRELPQKTRQTERYCTSKLRPKEIYLEASRDVLSDIINGGISLCM